MRVKKMFEKNGTGTVDWIKIFFFLVSLAFTLAVILLIYFAAFYENPPAEVYDVWLENSSGERVDTVVIGPDENVTYYVNWCKFTTKPAELRRIWVNHKLTIVPVAHPPSRPEGCFEKWPVTVKAPSLEPGSYELETQILYDINHLVERDVEYSIGTFIVEEVQ
jgi:hypothetical protein